MSCSVPSCRNIRRFQPEGITFHRFPKDGTLKDWLAVIGTNEQNWTWTPNKFICSKHFLPSDFIISGNRTFLKKNVVPFSFYEARPSTSEQYSQNISFSIPTVDSTVSTTVDSTDLSVLQNSSSSLSSADTRPNKRKQSVLQNQSSSTTTSTDGSTKRKCGIFLRRIYSYRFPSDNEKRRIWFSLLGWDEHRRLPKCPNICSNHFEPSDVITKVNGLRYLKPDANPLPCHSVFQFESDSLNLIHYDLPPESPKRTRFPQDPENRKHWFSLVGIIKGQHLPRHPWLCSDHFYPEDLLVRSNGARFIRKDANPRRCEGVIFLDDVSNRLTKNRYHIWLEALGIDPELEKISNTSCICSDHFNEEDIIIKPRGRKVFKQGAIPSLHLGPNIEQRKCLLLERKTPSTKSVTIPVASTSKEDFAMESSSKKRSSQGATLSKPADVRDEEGEDETTSADAEDNQANSTTEHEKETCKCKAEPEEGKEANNADQEETTHLKSEEEKDGTTFDSKILESLTTPRETIRVVWCPTMSKQAIVNCDNIVIIYGKKPQNICFAQYKNHEYFLASSKNMWKCNRTHNCPATLVIGRAPNTKIYEIAGHTCAEPLEYLNSNLFEKYALVNVLYYEGSRLSDLNSVGLAPLKNNIIVFCRIEAFYNGYKYIKSVVSKNVLKYACPFIGCHGSLKVSQVGINNKRVLEKGCHTCEQIQIGDEVSVNRSTPEGFIPTRPIGYNMSDELVFFHEINEVCPISELPIIYVKQEGTSWKIRYQDYEYFTTSMDEPVTTVYRDFKCCADSCSAKMKVTLDFGAVSEISNHTCNNDLYETASHVYDLIKIVKWDKYAGVGALWCFANGNGDPVGKPDALYVKVKYIYLADQNLPANELYPTDAGTIKLYFNDVSKSYVCYYKGYKYCGATNIQLCLDTSCAAALIIRQESSELMEVGVHTCEDTSESNGNNKSALSENATNGSLALVGKKHTNRTKEKLEMACPPLVPIITNNKSASSRTTESDNLSYTNVEIKNCSHGDVKVFNLESNDATTAYMYQNESGRSIIYYKGYTYHKHRRMYSCNKSRGCYATLIPHPSDRLQLAEVGQHNCTITSGSASTINKKPKVIQFKTCVVKEFSRIPGFDPNDDTIVTLLLSEFHPHNIVYYNGNMYVDDRTLSCERGELLTRRSCNLLYMCVKSNACSAGLVTNFARTTILEVGLHNCIHACYPVKQNKHFKEMKPVKFNHSDTRKPDMQGIIDSEVVATYFENRKRVAAYKGYTYIDRVTACCHVVGCKCLYVCSKHPDCSASILVDWRHSVLEVGLHSCCQKETLSLSVPNVIQLTPIRYVTCLLDSFGYGSKPKVLPKTGANSQSRLKEVPEKPNSVDQQGHKPSGVNNANCRKRKRRESSCEQQLRKKVREFLFNERVSVNPKRKLPLKAHQRFRRTTKEDNWDASIIPVLAGKGRLCIIHKGYIYCYTYQTKHSLPVESEWTCIKPNCLAVLHLKGTKVTFTSCHYCSQIDEFPSSQHSKANVIPFELFRGEINYLVYAGYIYQLSEFDTLNTGASLKCIYGNLVGCEGTLVMRRDALLLTRTHICKNFFGVEIPLDAVERAETRDFCANIIPKEEVMEETDNPENFGTQPLDDADEITIKEEILQEADQMDQSESYQNLPLKSEDPDCIGDGVTVKEEILEDPVEGSLTDDATTINSNSYEVISTENVLQQTHVAPNLYPNTFLPRLFPSNTPTVDTTRPIIQLLSQPDILTTNFQDTISVLTQDDQIYRKTHTANIKSESGCCSHSSSQDLEAVPFNPYFNADLFYGGSVPEALVEVNPTGSRHADDVDFEDIEDAIPISVVMATRK